MSARITPVVACAERLEGHERALLQVSEVDDGVGPVEQGGRVRHKSWQFVWCGGTGAAEQLIQATVHEHRPRSEVVIGHRRNSNHLGFVAAGSAARGTWVRGAAACAALTSVNG